MAQTMLVKGLAPSGLIPLPAGRRTHSVRTFASKQETQQVAGSNKTSNASQQEIYLGFPKGDYDRAPGRKGRVVKDDPSKYPGREDLGPLPSVVGGWAGGEAGLWQLREEFEAEKAQKKQGSQGAKKVLAPSSPVRAPQKNKWGAKTTSSAGRDAIYVGFGKDELDLRKTGVQGRVIYDEAYRYPDKEDMGGLRGVVGGFAGGETALKNFAETGELKLRKPGDPIVKKQFSPLTLAFLVIFAAAGGGVLLTSAFNLGDAGVQEIVQAPIDENTKSILLVAITLIGSAAVIGALRATVQYLREKLAAGAEGAQRFAVSAAFFFAVFLAARAILESS